MFPPYKSRAALIVGVDIYRDARIGNLHCAVKDAQLFAKTLQSACGFRSSDITTLFNADATRSNITREAERIGRALPSADSQFILFFAGHGDTLTVLAGHEVGFILPHDADKDSEFSTCIGMREIETLSTLMSAHHALYIFDCCFSGLVGVTTRGEIYPAKMYAHPAHQIMTAGMAHEAALENPSLGHGIYSYWLCEALRMPSLCDSPVLTATTLHQFLSRRVTEETHGAQTPQFRQLRHRGEGDNIFSLLQKAQRFGTTTVQLSGAFDRLYCNDAAFSNFAFNPPFNLAKVLPFVESDKFIDDAKLLAAESEILKGVNSRTLRSIISAYVAVGLFAKADAPNLRLFDDYFDSDVFDLMGAAYATNGMYKCALRWFGERIRREQSDSTTISDDDQVYSSVGHCLLALGLYGECIAWTRSCIGRFFESELLADAVVEFVASTFGGKTEVIEQVTRNLRFKIRSSNSPTSWPLETMERMREFLGRRLINAGVQLDLYAKNDKVERIPDEAQGNPFRAEVGNITYLCHKTNLLVASYNHAVSMLTAGNPREAKACLARALLVEPTAKELRDLYDAIGG